jgi:hypothetical protein
MPYQARSVRTVALACAALALLGSFAGGRGALIPTWSAARAEDGWRAEFDEVCAKTQDAMALSVEQLRGLVARCDKLAPALDRLDETQRKIFSRRLKACRELYQFVLETREKAPAP